jgi:agmatine deiminase
MKKRVLINDCYKDDNNLIHILRKNGLKTEFSSLRRQKAT